MCGFNRRFIPLLRACRERVLARGPIIQAVATFYKHYIGRPAYYDGAADVLTCDAIHAVDTLRFLCGEARQVASCVDRRYNFCDDAFNALMRFENGACGVLLANWGVGARRHTFEIHGRGISAFVDADDRALIYADGCGEPEVLETRAVAGSDEFRIYYGFEAENRHFVDCIRAGCEPETSLADATRTMRLVQQIYADRLDPDAPRWAGD
jgi:predicted dehydrogenase